MCRSLVVVLTLIAVAALAPPRARADLPPAAVAAMVAVPSVDDVCTTLRGVADAEAPCARVARAKVAGLGAAEAYAVTTDDVVRYAVVVVAAGQTWRSAPLELARADCGAGPCDRIVKQTPKLRAIKVAGAPAAALELTLAYQRTSDDGARPRPRVTDRWQRYQLLACGGAGAPACVEIAVGDRAAACTARLGATGTLTPSCGERITLPALAVAVDVDLDSHDILARPAGAGPVLVKHVLLGWDALEPVYASRMDLRAKLRTNAQAAAMAQDLAQQLRADPDLIDTLIAQRSEDPGSLTGEPYTITTDAKFVPEFKALALRLAEREVGLVRTKFGYHVVERIAPPPLDPLDSAAILARPLPPGAHVWVQHVLIAWKDVPAARHRPLDRRAQGRTKAQADTLAVAILAKVKAGGDMAALMKRHSEDPGSSGTGKAYEATEATAFVAPFKDLALRLKVGEAGLVKTDFGWHVIKRVPPPPPDPLESTVILERAPVAASAKVKHILLGWDAVNAGDARATKRTRAQLDQLVARTVARLGAGAVFETLMAELSEDVGSAASGESYDVTPDAGLVGPFKDLGLRLKVGEVGVVKTGFGIHIVKRVQ
ncbi:MAG: peptidylprolyl isomerase [Myxococcales bacterium]|nr:peptidylprolyl isomerase [Myxococcales bacterium]